MNQWHTLLFCAAFLFVGCRQEARDCLLRTRIMVLFSKMEMTEVSNPMQRKQKRPGMSSNSFDLKNTAPLSKMQRALPGDDMV